MNTNDYFEKMHELEIQLKLILKKQNKNIKNNFIIFYYL